LSPSTDSLPGNIEEPEIFCPHCDYNLRGLTEQRCPECGNEFDRELLIKRATIPDQPLPYGYPYCEKTSYTKIFLASLFTPARLGRLFPASPASDDARIYSLCVRAIGICIFAILQAFAYASISELFDITFLAIIPAVISFVYEFYFGRLLSKHVVPIKVSPDKRLIFWQALCHCFGTHFACAMILVGVYSVLISRFEIGLIQRGIYDWSIIIYLLLFTGLIFVWWWYCLGSAVAARSVPSQKRTAIILLIPIISFCFCVIIFMGMTLVYGLHVS